MQDFYILQGYPYYIDLKRREDYIKREKEENIKNIYISVQNIANYV